MQGIYIFIAATLLLLAPLPQELSAQSATFPPTASATVPESGFLSVTRYTNAFFGFTMPLPLNAVLNERTFSLTRGGRTHLLLAFHSPNKDLVDFTITAEEITGRADKVARNAANLAGLSKPKEVEIGGKRFWTAETPLANSVGGLNTAVYTIQLHGYVLEFKIVSFSTDTTSELEQTVAQITFFDPSKLSEVAGPDSKPYTPGLSPFPASLIGKLSAGSVLENSYTNDDLGFRYVFPQGWVLMSKAPGKEFAPEGSRFALGNSQADQLQHNSANPCNKQLLFVRQYLQNPASGQFNPMVILIAADRRCISTSRFPESVEDRNIVQQIAHDIMEYFRREDSIAISPATIRAFENTHRVMIDISQNFSLSVPGQSTPLTVLSSMLVMESGDYWVIWMFAAGNKNDLNELRATKIFLNDHVAVQ